jgi:hypothetical protein
VDASWGVAIEITGTKTDIWALQVLDRIAWDRTVSNSSVILAPVAGIQRPDVCRVEGLFKLKGLGCLDSRGERRTEVPFQSHDTIKPVQTAPARQARTETLTDAQTIASRFMQALNERDFDTIGTFLDEDVALDTLTGQRTIGAGPLRSIPSVFVFEFENGAVTRLSHYRNIRVFEQMLAR